MKRSKGKTRAAAHPAERVFDKRAIDEANSEALGKNVLKPLKRITEEQRESPVQATEHFKETIETESSGARFSAMESARGALLPSPSFGGQDGLEPVKHMSNGILSKENKETLTSLRDNEIKAIAIIRGAGRKAASPFIRRALDEFMILRRSEKRATLTAWEKIMEALGFRREEAAKNPIMAQFDKLARKP